MSSQLGKLLDERVLQPDTTDSATIKAGQTLRIIDIEGQQVADFVEDPPYPGIPPQSQKSTVRVRSQGWDRPTCPGGNLTIRLALNQT